MSDRPFLEFEKPIIELEKKISDMKDFAVGEDLELNNEIESLKKKLKKLRDKTYSNLTRWQRVQMSRHPQRPYTLDYINNMSTDFIELHGDRCFADDKAMVGGFGYLDDKPVMFVGQQKGKDTKQKVIRNFGMAHPEGYRKAMRLFELAEKFNVPVVVLIDTPGAFPGIGAEERGQAEAIAYNIKLMSRLKVPIIIVIIGEGASGGALGIGVGDAVMMLEYSWYSVISPEGCAAILWRDGAKAPEAAESLKVTSYDNKELHVIDSIIPEPECGAHTDPIAAAENVKKAILAALNKCEKMSTDELLLNRLKKYRAMGVFEE